MFNQYICLSITSCIRLGLSEIKRHENKRILVTFGHIIGLDSPEISPGSLRHITMIYNSNYILLIAFESFLKAVMFILRT